MIATFCQTFLPEIDGLFTQVLLISHVGRGAETGHADASKSKAINDQRLLELGPS